MKIIDGVLIEVSSNDIIDGQFTIPENVHTIGSNAFKGLLNLMDVIIPESVKEIKNNAFESCKNLSTIIIPKSVEKIEANAFSYCENLNKVKFNEGLKEIGEFAFSNCKSLFNAKLPNTLEKLEHHTFSNCENLRKVVLPNSLKEISAYTFENCKNLYTINLPESLESIERNAFMDCKELIQVKIPSKITEIQTGTFYGCEKLFKVSLPENLTKIDNAAFSNCTSLRFIKLPPNLNSIGSYAFNSCESLKNITIPKNTKTIGDYAFLECLKLNHLQIENGLLTIGKGAFKECGMKKLVLPPSIKTIRDSAFNDCPLLKTVDIQSNIHTISPYTFTDCYSLEKVKLPETVNVIDAFAFNSCSKLKEINLPSNLSTISDQAFSFCSKLNNITLPESLNVLGQSAFYRCKSLKSINIPENILILKSHTFSNCFELENITMNNNLRVIEDKAFDQCRKLKSVILPNTVTTIYDDAFRNCSSLKEMFIPKSVTSMGKYNGVSFTHYIKNNDGFTFLKSPETEIGKSMRSVNLNLSILSSNWDYVDMLLSEQTNKSVATFYNEFFTKLPKQQADKFLDSHNFTFYKQLSSKYNIQNLSTFKLLYNLGLFSKPIEHNGKKIDYAQKTAGVLLEKLEKHEIKTEDLLKAGIAINSLGFKKEFTDFFLENIDEFFAEEKKRYGFISKSYERFDEIQKTNTSNRGRQRQLKPTIQKFIEYLEENKYEGITKETRPIADSVSKFFGGQFAFDRGVEIMEEKANNNTPDHILSVHLKEEKKQNIQTNPFENIDKTAQEIQNQQTDTLNTLTQTAQNQFTYEWLSKNDPDNLILGKLCSCCAHVDGMGYGIMRASIVDPNVQNLVIRDNKDQIIAKATIFINKSKGYGVFNTIQICQDIPKRYREQIYEKYILGVKDFINQYNKENPNNPLRQINVGTSLNDLQNIIEKNHQKADNLLTSINYAKYGKYGNYYEGDCFREQYIIWESEAQKYMTKLINANQLLLPVSKKEQDEVENLNTNEKI